MKDSTSTLLYLSNIHQEVIHSLQDRGGLRLAPERRLPSNSWRLGWTVALETAFINLVIPIVLMFTFFRIFVFWSI